VKPRSAKRSQLLVEAVEAAHVRKDDDPDPGRFVRCREEGGEAVPVAGLQHEVVV